MRTVKVQGGLGNQLFCLGFAHTVARLTRETVALDIASFSADRYGHDFDLAPLAAALKMPLVRRPVLSSRPVTALMSRIAAPGYVCDRSAPADEDALAALVRGGGYFNGYWQDEAYLAPDFRAIARDFLSERAGPGPTPPIVIHCRTYKEEVRPDRRATPDAAWFARCLERLDQLGVATGDIALISDDPALALCRIGDIARPIRAIAGGTAWTDLGLMLRAPALILTNSTFSWWGGWCGAAEMVLYPAKGDLFHYAKPAKRFTVVE